MLWRLISRLFFLYHLLLAQTLLTSLLLGLRDLCLLCVGLYLFSWMFLRGSLFPAVILLCRFYHNLFYFIACLVFASAWIGTAYYLVVGSWNHDAETQNFAGRLFMVGIASMFYLMYPVAIANIVIEWLSERYTPSLPQRDPHVMPSQPEFNAQDMAALEAKLRKATR